MSEKPRLRRGPSKYRKARRWQVEIDYRSKLSPEELDWIDLFHEAEYGNNGHLMHSDVEEVRRLWRDEYRQRSDALNQLIVGGDPDEIVADEDSEKVLNELIDEDKEQQINALADEIELKAAVQRERQRTLRKQRLKRLAAKLARTKVSG